jgi:hypothetical protein
VAERLKSGIRTFEFKMSSGDRRKQNETSNIMGRNGCYLIGSERNRKKECRNGIATWKELKKMIEKYVRLVTNRKNKRGKIEHYAKKTYGGSRLI